MTEPLKIDLATYDENDVTTAARLLVRCFNAVANSLSNSTMGPYMKADTAIDEGSKLFQSMIGSDDPIQLTRTDVKYLKSAFMEIAGRLEYISSFSGTGDSINADFSERADVLIEGAVKNKIIKLPSPQRERPL